jgi:hypothetical protein
MLTLGYKPWSAYRPSFRTQELKYQAGICRPIREVLGLNLGPDTDYSDWGASWFSSSLQEWDSVTWYGSHWLAYCTSPRWYDGDFGAIGGMRISRGNRSIRKKPVPVPLCPPQIPYDLTRVRTRDSAVGSRRLTAWAMAWPCPFRKMWHSALNRRRLLSSEFFPIYQSCYVMQMRAAS